MTESSQTKAVIVASHIVYLVSILDKSEQVKRTSIDLVTWILNKRKKISLKHKKDIAKLADDIWQEVANGFTRTMATYPSMVIETLYFNHEKELRELYGEELGNRVVRFSSKQSYGDMSQYAKDSYEVADKLTEVTRKKAYDYLRSRDDTNI